MGELCVCLVIEAQNGDPLTAKIIEQINQLWHSYKPQAPIPPTLQDIHNSTLPSECCWADGRPGSPHAILLLAVYGEEQLHQHPRLADYFREVDVVRAQELCDHIKQGMGPGFIVDTAM